MNRSAYLTTGLAIKVLSRLSKADVVVHGQENIPKGPTIFVINHFTRIETLLLPYHIYNLTSVPVCSLAASSLFHGGLEKFFDLVGVVSTSDPQRDKLIVSGLLTGSANWIIFPEGSMIKTKKIVDGKGGRYMISSPGGMREPHTGAAALALRAELFRRHLLGSSTSGGAEGGAQLSRMLEALGLDDISKLQEQPITVVPVNLTYYPIRSAENIASTLAARLVKDLPERAVEEIMTEGTMLLSGVDLDIRFGKPIYVGDYLQPAWQQELAREGLHGFSVSEGLRERMRAASREVMQRYMHAIYTMTTINHEHLFASFLRYCPGSRIRVNSFRRRVYYAAGRLSELSEKGDVYLHKSILADQTHLLTDDRFDKFSHFLSVALEKGVVQKVGGDEGLLVRRDRKLSGPLSFHRGRIENPVEVIANEVEPLPQLHRLIQRVSLQPEWLLRLRIARKLYRKAARQYAEDVRRYPGAATGTTHMAGPFLLPGWRSIGVLLVHSYLAGPEEVLPLGRALRRQGYWVYGVRLPGHSTTADDLATRHFREWVDAVEQGYALLNSICAKVVLGGVAMGGSLCLDLAARMQRVTGVFAVCPPYGLRDYSAKFMPGRDVWNRLLNKVKKGEEGGFLSFDYGNQRLNYPRNPVTGVQQLGECLESLEKRYNDVVAPAIILQADRNPVVDPKGSLQVYEALGSLSKEYCQLNEERHVLVHGAAKERVFARIRCFVEDAVTAKIVAGGGDDPGNLNNSEKAGRAERAGRKQSETMKKQMEIQDDGD